MESLSRFVAAYQTVTPLKLGELWAIPIMLRLALIGWDREARLSGTAGCCTHCPDSMSTHRMLPTTAIPLIAAAPIMAASMARAADYNGFDVSGALIPVDELRHGGPPKDGIPPIDEPRFVRAGEASFLFPASRIIGLALNGRRRPTRFPSTGTRW